MGQQVSFRWKRAVLASAVSLALLCSCATKQQTGTLAGGVIGGVVGAQVGGKKGAVIGAAIGAVIGSRIGEALDEEDRKRMAELEGQAVRTNRGGSFRTSNGGRVSVEADPPMFEERNKSFSFASGVTPRRVVLSEPRSVSALVDTPLFASPSEAQGARWVLKQGVPVTVVATVLNLPGWLVVGEDKVGLGYLPARYLEPGIARSVPPATQQAKRAPQPTPQAKPQPSVPTPPPVVVASQTPVPTSSEAERPETAKAKPSSSGSKKTASIKPAQAPKAGPTTASNTVKTTTKEEYQTEVDKAKSAQGGAVVQASLECKVVKRKYTPPNSQETVIEPVKYCNEPPKGWQTVT